MQNNEEHILPPHNAGKVIKVGLWVMFFMFLFLAWISINPMATSVTAPGKVSAGIHKKTVQNQNGGTVKKIYVNNGDFVHKGDMLIKLDDTEIKAQLDAFKAQYQDTIGLLARLTAQKEDTQKIEYPKDLHDKNVMRTQKKIFYVTKNSNEHEKAISQNKIIELQNQIKGLQAVVESKKNSLNIIEQQLAEQQELFKQKLVSHAKIRDLQRNKNRLEGDIASNTFNEAKLKEQILEIKNQQLLREKKFKEKVLEKYVKAKSSKSDLESKIAAYSDRLIKTDITSPKDGYVVGLKIHTVGGVIKPGEPIMSIVPKNESLIIEAEIHTQDIDQVHVGLDATIKFPAFNRAILDVIPGKVSYVSADSFTNRRNEKSFYKVKIKVNKAGMQELKDKKIVLLPGMPAVAMITIGHRTFLSYLVKPFQEMLGRSFNEQ